MKFFLGKGHHHGSSAGVRFRSANDFYELKKSVPHGFPSSPSCLAYDDHHQLLAIGTKTGTVQIYGKPGVEFHYEFEEHELEQILFVPKRGQLVILCTDHSIHLLQVSHQLEKDSVQTLHSNNYFVSEDETDASPNKSITSIALSHCGNVLYVGTKSGNIHQLNTNNLELETHVISQDTILKSIGEDLKKPGSVEVIAEHPNKPDCLLIGYSRSLIVLWDNQAKSVLNHYTFTQQLESLCWNNDGEQFVSAHNDGSYIKWNSDTKQQENKLQYGPFPCKAITKINWRSTPDDGEILVFAGGVPRATYGDKEVISLIYKEKHQALDFTSKVVDFLIVSSNENVPEALVALVEEEVVVIDLIDPEWPQHKLPYLSCLHSSPITCSAHYSDVHSSIYSRIIDAANTENTAKFSSNDWPIKGGISKYQQSANQYFDLLLTGHENGTVRFWDSTTIALKHLLTISTEKLFSIYSDGFDDDDHPLPDEEEDEWPPFRKVGQFDPYSDDHRYAIRKIALCPDRGLLAVGGTAGQIVFYELQDQPQAITMTATKVNIVDEKESFVWKGHPMLSVKNRSINYEAGFQPTAILQLSPPAAITALNISSQWHVIAAGTAHGFGMFDYQTKTIVVCKSTLKATAHSLAAGGDALISRRKSFKKSLRESFRRLRKGRSQKGKSRQTVAAGTTGPGAKNAKYRYGGDDIETKPVERQIEARTEADMMSSMVRYLYFCSAVIVNNVVHKTFWVGTNAGTVFIYICATDKTTDTPVWQLAKEVQLKHKAPIVFIRLLDSVGTPLFENEHEAEKTLSRVLICSEEQFKLFTLPNFKTLYKFKLTAHEGARVRRLEIGRFANKTTENSYEHALMCLTNLGDVNVFSLQDFKRKYQVHDFIKKEDISGITSAIFTRHGEGFFLKSSSEYQRFSLSAKRKNFPECFILPVADNINLSNNPQTPEPTAIVAVDINNSEEIMDNNDDAEHNDRVDSPTSIDDDSEEDQLNNHSGSDIPKHDDSVNKINANNTISIANELITTNGTATSV